MKTPFLPPRAIGLPFFWAASLLVSAFLLGAALPARAEPTVTQVSGQAEIRANATAAWEKLRPNTALPAGAAIRVLGKGGATVQDPTAKTTLKINADTQLGYDGAPSVPEGGNRPASVSPVPHYTLPQGSADITVVPGKSLDLLAPLILTSVRGTRFTASVQSDGSSTVRVIRGTVLVKDKLGLQRALSSGESHTLTAEQYTTAIQSMPRQQSGGDGREGGRGGGRGGGGRGGGGDGGGGDGGDGGDD